MIFITPALAAVAWWQAVQLAGLRDVVAAYVQHAIDLQNSNIDLGERNEILQVEVKGYEAELAQCRQSMEVLRMEHEVTK